MLVFQSLLTKGVKIMSNKNKSWNTSVPSINISISNDRSQEVNPLKCVSNAINFCGDTVQQPHGLWRDNLLLFSILTLLLLIWNLEV